MLKFIIKRLAFVLLTLFIMSAVIFFVTHILPGDVAQMMMGQFASKEGLQTLREKLGLDRPLFIQYIDWLVKFVTGNWGDSLVSGAPIAPMVFERLRNSAYLGLIALTFSVPIGVILGVIAGLKNNSTIDNIISILSLSFLGVPDFVTGMILILIFALNLHWAPASALMDPEVNLWNALPKLILPGLTVSLVYLAYIVRMTRSGVIEVMRMPYVRTAKLKGLAPSKIIINHIMRNALLPTVTVITMAMGWLIGGLIVTESIFSYPGLGRLLLFAITRRDIPLIQSITMLTVTLFGTFNLLADVLYAYLDPRIRLA